MPEIPVPKLQPSDLKGSGAFDALVERIDSTPWMTPEQGRRIWSHFERHGPRDVLDIGTCYGTSAAYMAGALKALGGGRVVTVDSAQFDGGDVDVRSWCGELWERCGVDDMIEMVRIPHSNYAWWLAEQGLQRNDRTAPAGRRSTSSTSTGRSRSPSTPPPSP